MTGRNDTERVLDAYLAPEHDQLPDRVVDAALTEIARTPQRRALRVPWRFPLMTNTMRAAAGIAVVAIIGVGVLAFSSRSTGAGVGSVGGGGSSPAPTLSPPPTPTPAPSEIAPGITGWTTYNSEVYGTTFGYPDDWRLYAPAKIKWKAGDGPSSDASPYADVFVNPDLKDGDSIALWVWQMKAGSGPDITSREGLTALAEANMCARGETACETASDVAIPMCVGRVACGPGTLVPGPDGISAYFVDPETGGVTVVALGRHDDFPATARYGGGLQLVKSILTTMDVWPPEPGQIPSGS